MQDQRGFWLGGLIALAVLLPAESLPAQVFPNGVMPAMPGTAHMGFTIDRKLHRKLTRAKRLAADENYIEAVHLLQEILNVDEDSFFHPDPQDLSLFRSIKLEAQRQIGALPPAGLAAYEGQWGPKARQMLQEGEDDVNNLTRVVRHFFHTSAGYEAANRLAADHLDHGRPLAAALCLERLAQTPAARERFEPMLSLKTAYCWERAGMRGAAMQTLRDLQRRQPGGKITIAGRDVPLFENEEQALGWLAEVVGPDVRDTPDAQDQWVLTGGDPERNAESFGGSPYLNEGWRISTIPDSVESPDQERDLTAAFQNLANEFQQVGNEHRLTAIPSGQPLVVGGLVVFRGFGNTTAVDLATGKLAWTSADKDPALLDLLQPTTNHRVNAVGVKPLPVLLAQRAWRDNTFGAQSSDGDLVFAVEDLGTQVAPPPGNPGMQQAYIMADDNRLAAYEIKTGRLIWKLGMPRSDGPDPFAGAFFLGAPLPLANRLYCLVEFSGEIRLVVLKPRTGAVEWSQTLATAELDVVRDPYRRLCGLSPSFAAGILVCPTEAGAIVAVDLVTRSLVWGQRYAVARPQPDPRRMLQQQQNWINRTQGAVGNDLQRWIETQAIIAEGHVVVSPRDANEVYCLKLLDGSVVWKKPRGEALYIGGVYDGKVVLVGRTQVQALRLANGESAWREPTQIAFPSGRGFRSGMIYHLPLSTAEVASINLQSGRIVSRSLSRAGRVPGNLVSVPGAIISQGADFLESFRQLDALEAEIAADLRQNPNNANALAMRGEIYMQRGDLKAAYADLKRALELNPSDTAVREMLVSSLLEGLRVDFEMYRHATADIQKLLVTPAQKSAYLRLTASGLERAGDRLAAFNIYLQLADPTVADAELERQEGVSTRRDRIARARSEELYAAASPDERSKMDAELTKRIAPVRDRKRVDELRRLLGSVGGYSAAAEARALLLDLLIAEGAWLEAERALRQMERSPDQALAATATARLAKLLFDADHPRDAIPSIRKLGTTWADQVALEGKTGRELAAAWRTRPEIEREWEVPPWPVGVVEVERVAGPDNPQGLRAYRIPVEGDGAPYFADAILEVDTRGQEVSARDLRGRPLWKVLIQHQMTWIDPNQNRAYIMDHLVILLMGSQLFAIDTLGTATDPQARVLWQQNLTEAAALANGAQSRAISLPGGQRKLVDHVGQVRGLLGPVTPTVICFQRGRKLMAVEPLTGDIFWTREEPSSGIDLFGDEELLLASDPQTAGNATVYRMLDGTLAGTRPIPAADTRLSAVGRMILTSRIAGTQVVLESHDPWNEKINWEVRFLAGARMALIDNEEAAVLEPNGQFSVIDLAQGRRRWEPGEASKVEPQLRLQQLLVFRDDERYTVIANGPPPANPLLRAAMHGMHSLVISGAAYGFDRQTGNRLWSLPLPQHALDWSQPRHLPVLTFTCHFLEQMPGGGFGSQFEILVLDRRNGNVIYRDRRPDEQLLFVEPFADPEHRQLELRLFRSVLKLKFTDQPLPEKGRD